MLQPWMITSGWSNTFAVYRRSARNVNVFVPVPGCEAVPGRRKTTSNFDQMRAFVGQANTDNLLTSDELRFPIGYDVRAEDKVLVDGKDWLTIAGDPTQKTVIPRQVAFATFDRAAPKIDPDGVWSDTQP